MLLIEQLTAEHDLIETVAGSFRTFVRARRSGGADAADGPRFLGFFRLYAGQFHHAREEDTLFVSLQRDAELPGDRGPIAALLDDHRRMAGLLDRIEPLAARVDLDEDERSRLEALGLQYTEALWHHIDAENSVLFPESEARLRRHGVRELPAREPTPAEEAARVAGLALVERYEPVDEPHVIRGDGCVMCPAFVRDCRGLEREWWNESEWDEFADHLPSG
jgi:hemerythrin-like domain-containing protein